MGNFGDNLNKTKRYLKKNGLPKTVFAATERVAMKNYRDYSYEPPTFDALSQQKNRVWEKSPKISILVPAYETKQEYLVAMLNSVCTQTYTNWELVIADASASDDVKNVVGAYQMSDDRIVYQKLSENLGISGNTNQALRLATGEYIGLLDHDDTLTPDALYEVAQEIEEANPILIYSDEDKMDEQGEHFFEPHIKRKLNLDLILSNNYICHFCVIRADVMKELEFREEYDGAQDYDIILRTIATLNSSKEAVHIPKVLYHWRCHPGSTSANTESKDYAYESGRRAVVDFCMQRGWNVTVKNMEHLGFYRVEYLPNLFESRKRVGVVGGPVYKAGKIAGGAMQRDGKLMYEGLPSVYSGYMHQAVLQQEVGAVDLRNIEVREELLPMYLDFLATVDKRKTQEEIITDSLSFCEKVRLAGYRVLYDPYQKPEKERNSYKKNLQEQN